MSLLDQVAPQLARAFRRSDRSSQQRAIFAAAIAAGLDLPELDATAACIRHGGDVSALRRRLDALSKRLDDEYFKDEYFDESGAKLSPEARINFRKSRVAAALQLALSSNASELERALYEVLFASEDDAMQNTIRAAENTLGIEVNLKSPEV